MTEKLTVTLGQYGPDKSQFDPTFIDTATNVLPYEQHFGPMPQFQAFSDPLPGKPQGGYLSVLGNGVWAPFAATATRIYKLDFATSAWVDVSGNTAPYSTPVDVLWSATQFGDLLIFTNGVDQPVALDLTNPAAKFDLLAPLAPRAKNVTTTGDFLMFSYLTDMSDKAIQWSGLNDPRWWTPNQRSSDFQVFPDDGEIMSITGYEKGVVIFHEHCIREGVIDLTSPMVMEFTKTVDNHGTHARNSCVETGAGTFYISQDGFYRYSSGQPQRIGVERVDKFFFDDCELSDTYFLYSAEDPARKVIYLAYRSRENDKTGTYDHILVYNYGVDRWSLIKLDFKMQFLFNSITPGFTLDNLGDTGYTLDTLPFSLDSRIWTGSLPTFAAFDDQYQLGFFSGAPMKATVQTADIPLTQGGKRSVVKGFVPLSDAPTTKGRVAKKNFPGDPKTWGSQAPNGSTTGVIPARSSGLLHRFEVEIPAGTSWQEIYGVDVLKDAEGNQ